MAARIIRPGEELGSLSEALRAASHDALVVAVPLALVGIAVMVLVASPGPGRIEPVELALAAATGLCVLLPAVAYATAAVGLRRRQAWAVEIGPWRGPMPRRPCCWRRRRSGGCCATSDRPALAEAARVAAAAALPSACFLPAAGAFLLHTRRARLAARAFESRHGFSPLMSARPTEAESTEVAEAEEVG